MAENNQTSMTREERWAEIQKWVAWVDAQRLLGGELPDGVETAWVRDPYGYRTNVLDYIQNPTEPTGSILYLMWEYPDTVKNHIQLEFYDLYNKGATQ